MENKEINVLNVSCETEEIANRYKDLAIKMSTDETFMKNCMACNSVQELYQVYKDSGYTDMEFEDFEKNATKDFQIFEKYTEENKELSSEELESVVGGINFKEKIKSAINFIPVLGPYLTGTAKEKTDDELLEGLSGKALSFANFQLKLCDIIDWRVSHHSKNAPGFVGAALRKTGGFLRYAVKLVEW